MFHFISKILAFLISPITWVFILLIWTIFTKSSKRKKILLFSSFLTLFIFSNRFIINEVIRYWEVPINTIHEDKKYDYAIVLGGYSVYDPEWDRLEFIGAADRLFVPLQMYHQNQIQHFILSGGSGSIEYPERKEAIGVQKFLSQIGVKEKHIIIEPDSKNTHENAMFTKKILDSLQLKNKSILLVTSSLHMRRAKGCFEKENINFDILSVDRHSADRSFHYKVLLLPSADALSGWYYLIHEMVGYLSYVLAGYI